MGAVYKILYMDREPVYKILYVDREPVYKILYMGVYEPPGTCLYASTTSRVTTGWLRRNRLGRDSDNANASLSSATTTNPSAS